jgi:hypothetical protein
MKFCKFGVFLALFAAVCLPAAAQTRLKLDVPFNFVAAGKSLPAGHYTVDVVGSTDGRTWFISNDHTSVGVMSNPIQSPQTTHGPSLVFLQSGGTYSLIQIWTGQKFGREVFSSKVKQTLVSEGVKDKYVEIGAE